jgi:hypothetical protein
MVIKIENLFQKHWQILILLLLNSIIGLAVLNDYGVSVDEPGMIFYSAQVLDAYEGIFRADLSPSFASNYRYYGPAILTSISIFHQFILAFLPEFSEQLSWHLAYFIAFQITIVSMYGISKRFFRKDVTVIVVLLFNTQPLLWGHAFINPKDIPFMMIFTTCIAVGLWGIDNLKQKSKYRFNLSKRSVISDWQGAATTRKKFIIYILILTILLILSFITFQEKFNGLVEIIITDAYNGGNILSEELFNNFASNRNSVPVESYIEKSIKLSIWVQSGIILLCIASIIFLVFSVFSTSSITLIKLFKKTIHQIPTYLTNPHIIIMGIFLGLAISVRVMGLWAGFIISIYLISQKQEDSIAHLFTYWFITAITAYITWPYLWSAPIKGIIESIKVMSKFPWEGKVLFNGNYFYAAELPREYFPKLMAIQFTEPMVILFFIGLFWALWKFIIEKKLSPAIVLFAFWFLIPFIAILILQPPMYDNFRQFLFIVPPIFLICGYGLEKLFSVFNKRSFILISGLIIILPGVISIINLHPYQYVYYNNITGNLSGADGKYELDYWYTSYYEAMDFINKNVPENSKIIVFGASKIAETYARSDLIIEKYKNGIEIDPETPTFAILLSRYDKDTHLFPESESIFTAKMNGVIFSVIKDLTNSNISDR